MFGHLASKATAGKTGSAKSAKKAELPRTNAFVRALKDNNLRLSYGSLAVASEQLGEHTASGLSAGQRGSQICKNLQNDLQPQICRANGSYAKGTEWPEVPGADVATLKKVSHVRPEAVLAYVDAFEEATDAAANASYRSADTGETPAETPADDDDISDDPIDFDSLPDVDEEESVD